MDYLDNIIDKNGVSPVIGVILLVAVTVALVALVVVIVFDTGNSVSEAADATVQVSETSSGVRAEIIRNENVDRFVLRGPEGEEQTGSNVGDIIEVSDGSGLYTVIAILPDGTEETIRTIFVE